ncbi:MAG: hypothetical protein K0Q81_425 [Paenibacillus sp.]|nr:hypothetical protein [Paenibacillus sp.]
MGRLKSYRIAFGASILAVIVCLSSIWGGNYAEAGSTLSNSIVIISPADIYDSPDPEGQPIGTIGAIQAVEVDWDNWDRDPATSPDQGNWIRVKTWLGAKWIQNNAGVYYGSYNQDVREVTLMNTASLYNTPDFMSPIGASLGPQKLQVTGAIGTTPKFSTTARQFIQGSGTWYRVQTWIGEKWLINPALLENIRILEQSYDMKLSRDENSYALPYQGEGQGERVPTGVVQVTAFGWEGLPYKPQWYQIKWNGSSRWIAPLYEVTRYYYEINAPFEVTKEAKCSNRIYTYDEGCKLTAGTYNAIEGSGNWVHLQTGEGLKWVDLKTLMVHPENIVITTDEVTLDGNTESYYFPVTGQLFHKKGYFSTRTVRAYEKWVADDGSVWYNIQAPSDNEWVKITASK